MPTSHGTAQKEQHKIVSDGRAFLRPYAPKSSEDGKIKLIFALISFSVSGDYFPFLLTIKEPQLAMGEMETIGIELEEVADAAQSTSQFKIKINSLDM